VSESEQKSSGLRERFISAVVLAPPVLAALYFGGYYFQALALLITALMAWEWCGLVTGQKTGKGSLALIVASLVCVILSILMTQTHGLVSLLVLSLLLYGLGRSFYSHRAFWYLVGLPYIVLPMIALVSIREVEGQGMAYIVWLLLAVWATDVGAYFAGKTIGGPKLAPKISPKKTWAGLIGGMVCSGAVAAGVGAYFNLGTPVFLAGFGAFLAVIAQVGDFFESWVKRSFNAKDASNLIPGHGGVLDRVDGLLPVAVIMWVALASNLFGGAGP